MCDHLQSLLFPFLSDLFVVSSCSICTKKQNHHFIVPKSNFTLLQVWNPIFQKASNLKTNLRGAMFSTRPFCLFPPSKGGDHLTTYTFNTHAAKHTFCKVCGIQSFYTPRSNPDGYGMRERTVYTPHDESHIMYR